MPSHDETCTANEDPVAEPNTRLALCATRERYTKPVSNTPSRHKSVTDTDKEADKSTTCGSLWLRLPRMRFGFGEVVHHPSPSPPP